MENYFSKNLKYLREKRGIEQQELAEKLKVPRSTLACWETGARSPKIEQISKIVNYFNVEMDIITKDYQNDHENLNKYSELDSALFSKFKDLNEEDKELIANIIETRKKQIDKELDGE